MGFDDAEQSLEAYLSSALTRPGAEAEITRDDLMGLWAQLTGLSTDDPRLLAFEDALHGALGRQDAELWLKPTGWTLNLRQAAVRGALVAATVAGALAAAGVHDLAPAVLPAVLPLVLEVKEVRLKASEEELYAELQLLPAAMSGGLPPEQLYNELPDEIRSSFSRVDFVDFLDKLRLAGRADQVGPRRVVILPESEGKVRLTLR